MIYQFRGNHLTAVGNHMPMGSHSVTCHPTAVIDFPHLPQPKLVLDLATRRCKAEFTWVVVMSQDSLLIKDGHLSEI